MTIKRELEEMEGISKVEGDPDKKEIIVTWGEPAAVDALKSPNDRVKDELGLLQLRAKVGLQGGSFTLELNRFPVSAVIGQ